MWFIEEFNYQVLDKMFQIWQDVPFRHSANRQHDKILLIKFLFMFRIIYIHLILYVFIKRNYTNLQQTKH